MTASPMDTSASLFQSAVSLIFTKWHAVEFAVANGSGGSDTKEKVNWLPLAFEQWVSENGNVDETDIREFLSSVLYDEFDLLVEDGSDVQVAQQLHTAYTLKRGGKLSELTAMRDELVVRQRQQVTFTAENGNDESGSESDSGDESDNVEMASEPSSVPALIPGPSNRRNVSETSNATRHSNSSRSAATASSVIQSNRSTVDISEMDDAGQEAGDVEMDDDAEWNVVQSNRKKRKN